MSKGYIIGQSELQRIPEFAAEHSARRAFITGDANTYPLAGEQIRELLFANGIDTTSYQFPAKANGKAALEPDENAVGSLMLHYDASCDMIIGIGSGVINDLCKLLAGISGVPYIIVATAPSMDGYASPLSSMVRDGLKVSIPTKKADLILADIDILRNAPLPMLKAGLGDMLAKYVSICEWRLGALITGEIFDEEIARTVRQALRKCVDNAEGLLRRDDEAICAVFDGLVLTGEAMKRAGCSRPASGAEHYFSHLWDMRALEFGTPMFLHGTQCAVATRICVGLYQRLKDIRPDRKKALRYAEAFDLNKWNEELRKFLGKAAEPLIMLEKKEKKYDPQKHRGRLGIIISQYDNILNIIEEELPSLYELDELYRRLELQTSPPENGVIAMTVKAGKDIRDKYVLPRLLWDLGVLDDFCEALNG